MKPMIKIIFSTFVKKIPPTQFTNLVNNGGTISITQGGNTVTYVGVAGPSFFIENNQFFLVSAQACTQTVTSASPFVYASPISISFS